MDGLDKETETRKKLLTTDEIFNEIILKIIALKHEGNKRE